MKVVTYKQAIAKPVADNNEKFVRGDKFSDEIKILRGASSRVAENNPELIFYIRKGTAQRLAEASRIIKSQQPDINLGLGYGYRPMEVQVATFNSKLAQIRAENPDITEEEDLFEMTNQYIAVPEMAAHPTGGAVDVALINSNGEYVDMGFPFLGIFEADVSKISWFAEGLTNAQQNNRQLLLNAMTQAGFAPYWGEWWHYSFGDKEWAVFYNQAKAM
jgi:D-alanyl-D-alanine dipeptidase